MQGGTKVFNPTLPDSVIETQRRDDPTAAASEWDAEFRSDISTLLDDEFIDAAIEHGRPLATAAKRYPAFYRAFTDAAGGTGRDSDTLAVAHMEAEHYVIDLVRGTNGKFDPQAVTAQYAELLKEYRIGSVTGDNYAAQWVAGAGATSTFPTSRATFPNLKSIWKACRYSRGAWSGCRIMRGS